MSKTAKRQRFYAQQRDDRRRAKGWELIHSWEIGPPFSRSRWDIFSIDARKYAAAAFKT